MISPSGTPARVKRRSPAVISVSAPGRGPPAQQVHGRAADEAGHEQVRGPREHLLRLPICSALPADMTTIRSASVIASIWSWVT